MARVNRANKKIKVGDTVRILAGKENSKEGILTYNLQL